MLSRYFVPKPSMGGVFPGALDLDRFWSNVLDGVNLRVQQGEFVSLIGHSGCGKSTVLNIVAGLLQATEGGVVLEGREVTDPGPDRAVVFQNHSLLPWLSAYDNVRLAVDQVFKKTKTKQERHKWTLHNLELVHMSHALDRKPGEISGGMKQRVGIARALAMEPKVLLMDEPFGALDSLTRTHMQDSLMEIQARLNNTVIMITHDVDEAVLLSDRIVMMTNGPSPTIGDILQQATIQVGQLAKSDHLEFWDSVGNHAQGMDETELVRIKVGLECCRVHQETNGIVGDQQAV